MDGASIHSKLKIGNKCPLKCVLSQLTSKIYVSCTLVKLLLSREPESAISHANLRVLLLDLTGAILSKNWKEIKSDKLRDKINRLEMI